MSRTTLWALVGLLGYTLLFFAPAALGGGQFFFRDVSQNHYPMRAFAQAELASGALPLWNPHLTFGQPAAANPNYGLLHPTSILLLLLPLDAAFRWGIVLQYLLAATGMYFLMRDLRCSGPASAAAALAFGFSGPMASLGNLYNVLGTAAWLPLTVLLMRRAVASGRVGWVLGAAAALAVQIVGGEPMILLGTLALGIPLAWITRPEGGSAPAGVRLAGVLATGMLLAAVQILPTLELLPLSERGGGFDPAGVTKWSTHPFRLLELIVPGLFGDPTVMAPLAWWGEGFFETTLPLLLGVYLGAPVVLLAVTGCGEARRGATARILVLGAGLSLILALGKHGLLFVFLQRFVPGFDSLRYPSKFLVITVFCASTLAALGLDALARRERLPRSTAIAGGILVGLPALAAGLLAFAPGVTTRLLHGPMNLLSAAGGAREAQVGTALVAVAGHAAVAAGLGLAVCILLIRRPAARMPPGLLMMTMVALIGADLLAANAGLNPTVDPEWYRAEPRFLDTIRDLDPDGRIYRFPRPPGFGVRVREGASAASTGFLWDRLSLRNATGLQYGLSFGWDRNNERLNPESSASIARQMDELPLTRQVELWKLGAVRFVVAYAPLEHRDLRLLDAVRGESSHPLLLYEVIGTLPRARMVADRPPGEELPAGAEPVGAPAPSAASTASTASNDARIREEATASLTVETRAEAAGFLILADTFFPGWTAMVDGRAAAIEPAYGLFRAVAVPAGPHEVTFRYRPGAIRAGRLLAVVGLSLPFLLAAWTRRRWGGP